MMIQYSNFEQQVVIYVHKLYIYIYFSELLALRNPKLKKITIRFYFFVNIYLSKQKYSIELAKKKSLITITGWRVDREKHF